MTGPQRVDATKEQAVKKQAAKVEIEASAETVWGVLADFGNVSVFNPTVTESYSTTDDATGVGAARHCDLAVGGATIEERIVEWNEGSSYTIEIYDGTRNPFAKALGTLAVEPLGDNRSVVTMSLEWKAKGGIFSGFLGRALKGQNQKAIAGVLAGLKHHVETGDPVAGRHKVDRSAVTVV